MVVHDDDGQLTALQDAVASLRTIEAVVTPEDRDYVAVQCNLMAALVQLAGHTGRLEDAKDAANAGRRALAAAPADLTDLPLVLSNLSAALWVIYELNGELGTLKEAIHVGRQTVAAAPPSHPNLVGYLSNLGTALRLLGERTGQTAALAEAVSIGRQALAAIGRSEPDPAKAISSLSVSLRLLYTQTGELALLAEAADLGRRAVADALIPDRGLVQGNLAAVLRTLGRRTGQIEVLEEAVAVGREAVEVTPPGHRYRYAFLSNLNLALRNLFDCTGRTDALAEAVAAGRQAVAAAPPGHPSRGLVLSNLGASLMELGKRTDQVGLLAEAADFGRQAVAATPDGHPDRASRLSNLAITLNLLGRTGPAAALEESVAVGRQAVAAAPAGHPDRGMCLNNLCSELQDLYVRTGQEILVFDAITAGRLAVTAVSADHPDWGGYQLSLGSALGALSELVSQAAARKDAAACFAAAGSSTAPAHIRLSAYRAQARLAGASPGQALAAMEAAVALLPQAVSRQLPLFDRSHRAALQAGMAAQAAAAAVAADDPVRAVELLEQCRGMLVADVLEARSGEFARLDEQDAADLAEARRRIQALDLDADPQRMVHQAPDSLESWDARITVEAHSAARRDAQSHWQELLARIRSQPHLSDFLHVDRITRLARAAADGPIVYVYADSARCDALILRLDPGEPVTLVELPGLTQEEAVRQVSRLMKALREVDTPGGAVARAEILDVLAWAWDTITGPVMNALEAGVTSPDSLEWPRIWWCPVGFLTGLPLHATGHHCDPAGERRTVLDRVVSSYIPTARALEYARTHPGEVIGERTVLIASPGTPELEGVLAETSMLVRLVPGSYLLENPTRDRVLAVLHEYTVAHFACHGIADPADAAASRLLLDDHETAALTVADINALDLPGAALAYLSACETSVATLDLADEAVHIAAAFHLAGYRHVIGTLWPISDDIAKDLAEDLYGRLTSKGTTTPATNATPLALHYAVRSLRDSAVAEPEHWASHIHVGC
jgi:tetratricopeptide (TPR) repeat protein